MKDLKAVKGTYYIRRLIEEGEHVTQDFKFAVNDARKIARSLSAFANNRGGRLLVGVKDNGVIAGIRNEEDIYVMEQAAQLYCRPAQELRFTTFVTDNGLLVLRVEIDAAGRLPVLASEPDGSWRAYYRVADENIVASPLMVAAWRRAASAEPAMLQLGDAENGLLELLRRQTHVTVEQFMTSCHISRRAAEETVTGLYAMGVISFDYHDGAFQLVAL